MRIKSLSAVALLLFLLVAPPLALASPARLSGGGTASLSQVAMGVSIDEADHVRTAGRHGSGAQLGHPLDRAQLDPLQGGRLLARPGRGGLVGVDAAHEVEVPIQQPPQVIGGGVLAVEAQAQPRTWCSGPSPRSSTPSPSPKRQVAWALPGSRNVASTSSSPPPVSPANTAVAW